MAGGRETPAGRWLDAGLAFSTPARHRTNAGIFAVDVDLGWPAVFSQIAILFPAENIIPFRARVCPQGASNARDEFHFDSNTNHLLPPWPQPRATQFEDKRKSVFTDMCYAGQPNRSKVTPLRKKLGDVIHDLAEMHMACLQVNIYVNTYLYLTESALVRAITPVRTDVLCWFRLYCTLLEIKYI